MLSLLVSLLLLLSLLLLMMLSGVASPSSPTKDYRGASGVESRGVRAAAAAVAAAVADRSAVACQFIIGIALPMHPCIHASNQTHAHRLIGSPLVCNCRRRILEVEIRHFERSRSPHVALAHTYRGAGGAKSRHQRNKTALFALVVCDSFVCFTDAIYIRV